MFLMVHHPLGGMSCSYLCFWISRFRVLAGVTFIRRDCLNTPGLIPAFPVYSPRKFQYLMPYFLFWVITLASWKRAPMRNSQLRSAMMKVYCIFPKTSFRREVGRAAYKGHAEILFRFNASPTNRLGEQCMFVSSCSCLLRVLENLMPVSRLNWSGERRVVRWEKGVGGNADEVTFLVASPWVRHQYHQFVGSKFVQGSAYSVRCLHRHPPPYVLLTRVRTSPGLAKYGPGLVNSQ